MKRKEFENNSNNSNNSDNSDQPPLKVQKLDESSNVSSNKVPKIKVALLIGYSGLEYQGMQINPGANTIELHLQKALFKAGAIDERNMERLQKISWMRCARTDKGVHAAGQIVSCKLLMADDTISKTNEHLPKSIKIFDYVRVTGGFNSKNECNARTYEYTLRTEVLRPSERHPNYKNRDSWVFNKEEEDKFREFLKKYEGTHSYHNFTKRGDPKNASMTRYIMNMELSSPFTIDDMEFVRITLKGQSFILHQIRKMIATASIIFRDGASSSTIDRLLSKDTQVNLAMVPGLGLLLKKCYFTKYQRTKGKNRPPLTFLHCQDEVEEFTNNVIYHDIYTKDKEEKITEDWLQSLEEKVLDIEYLDSEHENNKEIQQKLNERRKKKQEDTNNVIEEQLTEEKQEDKKEL